MKGNTQRRDVCSAVAAYSARKWHQKGNASAFGVIYFPVQHHGTAATDSANLPSDR